MHAAIGLNKETNWLASLTKKINPQGSSAVSMAVFHHKAKSLTLDGCSSCSRNKVLETSLELVYDLTAVIDYTCRI